jgi:hypothetical protein
LESVLETRNGGIAVRMVNGAVRGDT